MIFDTHLHAVSGDQRAYPRDPRSQGRGAAIQENPAERIVWLTKAAGVDYVALVQFVTIYGYNNAYTADCLPLDPRFVGVASVDPFAQDAADQLEVLVRQCGMKGLRLFTPSGWAPTATWPDEPTVQPILRRAAELQVPVAVQLRPDQLPSFRGLACRFPEVPLLVDHLAGVPRSVESAAEDEVALLALSELRNVSLKFSSQNLRHPAGPDAVAPLFRRLLREFGAGRLLWGSNFPVASSPIRPYSGLLDDAQRLLREVASPQQQLMMLGDNAARIYGVDPSTPRRK